MKLSRRSMLKWGAAAPVALSGTARAALGPAPALIIADSRLPASRAFAAGHSAPVIDVAHEDARFWSTLRSAAPQGGVVGLTSWSDFVIVRGALEGQGKRLKSQSREGRLFRWEMR